MYELLLAGDVLAWLWILLVILGFFTVIAWGVLWWNSFRMLRALKALKEAIAAAAAEEQHRDGILSD